MKKWFLFSVLLISTLIFASFSQHENFTVGEQTPVWQVLEYFGEEAPAHKLDNKTSDMIQQGRELVLYGRTKDRMGKKTKLQSKHFKCTSCHNVVNDEGDLVTMDAQARLDYTKEQDLPFLQGTTLYGVVNRTTYYNGDYQKKYADNPRIKASHTDLREAVQLCATECAQGRPFKKWELDAVLAYLWSLELKMGDLALDKDDYASIRSKGEEDGAQVVDWVTSKYAQAAPATFGNGPKDAVKGYEGHEGNPENGAIIYDLSCMHCHEGKKYSLYELDYSKLTFQQMKRSVPRYGKHSVYQVSRYGSPSVAGKRAYMPQYPLEKMTNQQLEDLRAYIDKMAK